MSTWIAPARATLGYMPERKDELAEDLVGDAVAVLVPFGGSIGKRVARSLTAEWRRNASKALRAAESASGLSREDFAEWAEREPRAVPLYMKVLWTAGMNGHDQTLRAMGAVLGAAAEATAHGDDEGFENAELALRAMSELTARHFRVLQVLDVAEGIALAEGKANYEHCMPDGVAERAGLTTDVANQCLINLAGAGLTSTTSVYGGIAYPLTELGRAVILAARSVGEPQ